MKHKCGYAYCGIGSAVVRVKRYKHKQRTYYMHADCHGRAIGQALGRRHSNLEANVARIYGRATAKATA